MRPLRLVHLIPADGHGGVENAARALAAADLPGVDQRLLVMSGETLARDEERVAALGLGNLLSPLAQLRAAKAVARLAPDVLVCSLWRSLPAGLLAKRMRPSSRLVVFLHAEQRVHALDDYLHRLAVAKADAVWADAEASAASVAVEAHQQRCVISPLLDRLAPLPGKPPAPRFVSWGRLHAVKALDRAIHFIAKLHRLGVEAKFDIWGADQGAGPGLRRLAADLGLAGHVRFHGAFDRGQLQTIAAPASFFLQTSIFEGFGMAAAEAMQLGLVPVATPVGAIATYCRPGVSGVHLDPDDLPTAATKVRELIGDPEAFTLMREEAIATFARTPLFAEAVASAAHALFDGVR